MVLLEPDGNHREARGVFGPRQGVTGEFMHRGTHYCAGHTHRGCNRPAVVTVFGKTTASATGWARFDVCREDAIEAARDLIDPWICALAPADTTKIGDYCPHCGQWSGYLEPEGRGHLRICPIGLSWPDRAREAGVPWVVHDRTECEVCTAWLARIPGPAG